MSKDICKKCDSFDGTCCQSGWAFPYDIDCSDSHCDYFREKQKPTLFDRITTSPQVLAEKLVYCNVTVKEHPDRVELTKGWYSTIIPKKVWSNKEEAIAATVEKLKEVKK